MTAPQEADDARIDAWMMLCDVMMDWLDEPEYREGVIEDLARLPFSLRELETILLEEVAPPLSNVSPDGDRGLVRHVLVRRIEELREEPEMFPEDEVAAARAMALVGWALVEPEVAARRAGIAADDRGHRAKTLFHEVRGAGPDLVLLHGWAMHAGIFAPLVERLESAFTLHLVDLPGHGRSRFAGVPLTLADAARAVADVVPERALWLGWSLGGLVALHAAATLSGRVRGLIALAASPRFVRADGWDEGMPAAVFQGFAEDLRTDYPGTIDRFLMLEAQGSAHMRDELRLLRTQVFAHGEPVADVMCDGLSVLEASDLRATLPSLAMPSLWIAGRRDRLVDPEAMRAAAGAAPRATFHLVASGGHAPFLTEPEEVANAIADFAAAVPR